jgi:type II secretory pathway pseudopilin PulG
MKRRNSAGFTLVELIAGMLGMAIIALAVGAMLVYGWMGWRRTAESIQMQRNSMVALRILERRIRNASLNEIAGFGVGTTQLTFSDDPDFSSTTFSEGSYVQVDAFSATTNSLGGVDLTFSLSTTTDTDDNTYSITLYPRNES